MFLNHCWSPTHSCSVLLVEQIVHFTCFRIRFMKTLIFEMDFRKEMIFEFGGICIHSAVPADSALPVFSGLLQSYRQRHFKYHFVYSFGVFTKEVAIKRKQSRETAWNLLYSIGVTLRSSSKLHKKAIFGALLFRQISQNLIHHKELRLCNLKPAKWRVSRHFHEIFRRNFEGWRQEIERLKQWSRPWNGILLKTNIIWPNDECFHRSERSSNLWLRMIFESWS